MSLLDRVDSPAALKNLTIHDLSILCQELRTLIINTCAKNGGHLGGSLGTVELITALHYIFDSPTDKIVFDVGHQAYAHKILTGRKNKFHTLRQKNGLAPFLLPAESKHDAFIAGHAGNSISAALGLSYGLKRNHWSIAVIGDGSLVNGMALEALNHLGTTTQNVLIIINDNKYSIDKSVGAVAQNKNYQSLAKTFNLPYHFCKNGNDVSEIIKVLTKLKPKNMPQVLHLKTTKGCGSDSACAHQLKMHSISGNLGKIPSAIPPLAFQNVVSDTLFDLVENDQSIMVVTPAMSSAVGLNKIAKNYPTQFFDVGIAEEHAVTLSAGLAASGKKVFCHLYSTFAQRGFDQFIHDVALQNLPVTFLIDRAGIVGEDGATHHGIFDLSFFNLIPGFTIFAPRDEVELKDTIKKSLLIKSPVVIRYPRANLSAQKIILPTNAAPSKKAILSAGFITNEIPSLNKNNYHHYHFLQVKPFDKKVLQKIIENNYQEIITVEENVKSGGFGENVASALFDLGFSGAIKNIALPDHFLTHATRQELLSQYLILPLQNVL